MPTRADTLPIYVMAIYHIDVSLLLAGPLCHVYDVHSNYLLAYTYVVGTLQATRADLATWRQDEDATISAQTKTNVQLINSFN